MVVLDRDSEATDRLFHALADRTRRDLLDRVLVAPQSVSALARHYPVSLTAIQKHVGVLESAGLVTKHRAGREQVVTIEVDRVRQARALLDRLEQRWRDRVGRMAELLAEVPTTDPDPDPNPHHRGATT